MGGYPLGDSVLSPAIRRGLKRCTGCGLALAMLLAAASCWATTYRWVDEHGVVHYGDSIPARYSGAGHDVLDEQGRVIKRVESFSKATQENQKRAQEAARQAAEQRAVREQQRHDSALMATYDSTAEIDQARDRALAQEQALIDSLKVMRKQSQSATEARYTDAQIRLHLRNLDTIRLKYSADKARYQELTGRP
jgi:rhamnose utilization protein RhaD (predicted bifunctional aldolase and dehydrogenase)